MKTPDLHSLRQPRRWILLYWICFAIAFIPLIFTDQIILCAELFFFSGVLFFIPTLIPNDSLFGPIVTRFTTNTKEVWLTFDDGPDPEDTPRILDLLDQYQAKATFFVIGKKADQYPELIQKIIEKGHTVGNHTFNHPVASFWIAFPKQIQKELSDCHLALTQIPGIPAPTHFRAPVGMVNFFLHPILEQQQLTLIGWSARGYDTMSNDPSKIVNRIWKKVHPGSIILLHEGISTQKNGERICPKILEGLLHKLSHAKYRCVTPKIDS